MIRTCLFDMGNVLVHFSHDRMCAQLGALCGRTGPEIRRLVFDAGHQWEFERGRLTEAQFHRRFIELVGSNVEFEHVRRAGSDIFELNASIIPVLRSLKARGCRLVLLSNTSVSHFEHIRREFGVLQLFDEHVVSFRVGAIKPEPAIFAAALQAIRCPPQECFYTDDVPEYVAAGRRYGLDAEVFTDTPALRRQLAARGIALEAA